MKKAASLTFMVTFLVAISTNGLAQSDLGNISSSKNRIDIRVADNKDWGDVSVSEIQSVLYSATDELLLYFPNRKMNSIFVQHSENGPISLYGQSNMETIILLDVENRRWAQLVYQFSHELTHILSRYDNKVNEHPNKWFEEALCVTASMFTLRKMAVNWRTSATDYGWKSYAPSLREYADNAMGKSGRQLPSNMTFAKWYKENESNLRSQDVDLAEARNKQFVIASKLLPIFEKNPSLWESVSYLNVEKSDGSYLQNYLDNWYRNAPKKHRKLIQDIIYMFRE